MRGTFKRRRMVLEKAPFTSRVEAAELGHACGRQRIRGFAAPENLLLVGRDCLRLVCVGRSLCFFTSPAQSFSAPSAAALAQPLQTVTGSGHMEGGGICSLRSGVGRAFPTLSVWEAAPEKGGLPAPGSASVGWRSRPGSQVPPPLPPLFIMRKEMGHTQLS